MPHRYEEDWEELARREPYFAVLTERRFLRAGMDEATRRAFFETGEADMRFLFSAIRDHEAGAVDPRSALDFGCGVGRITFALANRAPEVVGCDVSSEMIAIAKENAASVGAANVTFTTTLRALEGRRFDLICSLIVFQHIPVKEGMSTLSRLLGMLAPDGIAALHFTLRRPGGPLRRLARRARAAVPLLHHLALRLEGDPLGLPYMQMNEYDESEIRRSVERAGAVVTQVIPRSEGGVEGAIFIVRPRPVSRS